MGLQDATNQKCGGGGESTKLLGMLNPIWRVFEKKSSQKLKNMQVWPKPMVRDLAVGEALQEEIKETLEHNNQSYVEWCAQIDKYKKQHLFFLALYVSITDMKYFRTICNTPQPCHSHFCC